MPLFLLSPSSGRLNICWHYECDITMRGGCVFDWLVPACLSSSLSSPTPKSSSRSSQMSVRRGFALLL